MQFCFQLIAAHPARRPVIVLEGQTLAGSVQVGERVSVPLACGGYFVGTVLGVEPGRVSVCLPGTSPAGEQSRAVGLAVGFPAGYQASDIALGVVTTA